MASGYSQTYNSLRKAGFSPSEARNQALSSSQSSQSPLTPNISTPQGEGYSTPSGQISYAQSVSSGGGGGSFGGGGSSGGSSAIGGQSRPSGAVLVTPKGEVVGNAPATPSGTTIASQFESRGDNVQTRIPLSEEEYYQMSIAPNPQSTPRQDFARELFYGNLLGQIKAFQSLTPAQASLKALGGARGFVGMSTSKGEEISFSPDIGLATQSSLQAYSTIYPAGSEEATLLDIPKSTAYPERRKDLGFGERVKTAFKSAGKGSEFYGVVRAGLEIAQIGGEKLGLTKPIEAFGVNINPSVNTRIFEEAALFAGFSPAFSTTTQLEKQISKQIEGVIFKGSQVQVGKSGIKVETKFITTSGRAGQVVSQSSEGSSTLGIGSVGKRGLRLTSRGGEFGLKVEQAFATASNDLTFKQGDLFLQYGKGIGGVSGKGGAKGFEFESIATGISKEGTTISAGVSRSDLGIAKSFGVINPKKVPTSSIKTLGGNKGIGSSLDDAFIKGTNRLRLTDVKGNLLELETLPSSIQKVVLSQVNKAQSGIVSSIQAPTQTQAVVGRSLYAGTGLYERSSGGQIPGQLNINLLRADMNSKSKTTLLNIPSETFASRSGVIDLTQSKVSASPKLSPGLGLNIGQIPFQENKVITIPKLDQPQIPRSPRTPYTPFIPYFPPRFPPILPPSFLALSSKPGRFRSSLGSFIPRYSPSLTARTFRLFGTPSKQALTGEVTPFERRYLLGKNKKKKKLNPPKSKYKRKKRG